MNIKHLILMFVLVVQVRSDCDGYLKCLSDLIHDFLDDSNSTKVENKNVSDDNITDIPSIYKEGNNTISVFDISQIGKSITQALSDVTTMIRDELAGMFNLKEEAHVQKDIDNKTVIHVMTFGLNIIGDNGTNRGNITDTVQVPAVIVNNFTEFNDELNALKVEIEKNLQAELEAFISKITENDTLDWEEVTEDTSLDFQDNIVESKSKENIESSTEVTKEQLKASASTNGNNVNTTIVQNETITEPPMNNKTVEIINNDTIEITTTRQTTDNKPKLFSSKIVKMNTVSTTPAIMIQHGNTSSTSSTGVTSDDNKRGESKTDATVSKTDTTPSSKDDKILEIVTTSATTSTTTKPSTTNVATDDKATKMQVSSTTTTTIKPVKVQNITTYLLTVEPIDITVEPRDTTVTSVTTTKPQDTTAKKDANTSNAQAIPRIDYKLIEHIHDNEISKDDTSDYDIEDDNSTDYPIIDYVELYKDTTNEAIDYKSIEIPVQNSTDTKTDLDNTIVKDDASGQPNNGAYSNDTTRPESIFPWIATIFIKNDTNNQFDYYCDGALLSTTVVLTAGRCVIRNNKTVDPADLLVFLGKRSLQVMTEAERISKVKKIRLHEDFKMEGDRADNDLAALLLDEPVVYSDFIKAACIMVEGEVEKAVTTAWGDHLTVVPFIDRRDNCDKNRSENQFCATYGNDVRVCPSYGGVYCALGTGAWCLRGIRSSVVAPQPYCTDTTIVFTLLDHYTTWVDTVLEGK